MTILISNQGQGLTITIKLPYVITYVCQNFGVHDVRRQIPKKYHQASYLLPNNFPKNFPKAHSYLKRMKGC